MASGDRRARAHERISGNPKGFGAPCQPRMAVSGAQRQCYSWRGDGIRPAFFRSPISLTKCGTTLSELFLPQSIGAGTSLLMTILGNCKLHWLQSPTSDGVYF